VGGGGEFQLVGVGVGVGCFLGGSGCLCGWGYVVFESYAMGLFVSLLVSDRLLRLYLPS